MSQVIIGILIGLGMTVFAMFIIFLKGDNIKDYGGALLIIGIVACLVFGLLGYEFDIDEKIDNTIKTTINANYDNVVNYHYNHDNIVNYHYNSESNFVSNGSKYTFEYNKETETLTVFKGSDVDAVFVNGVKQNNQKTSDKTDKKKDCVSYKTDDADKTDTDKTDNSSDTANNSSSTVSSTAVSLQQKIQNKIQSRYSDAVITGFDTIKMSGIFSCDNIQYNFQWKDDMLEVINVNNADDVTYYKIAQ